MSNEAIRLKEAGNRCFHEKRYNKAIDLYTQSLHLVVSPTVLGNRAQCYLNLERWSEALMDCSRALELDPTFDKALYRRALALENIGLKASAVKDLDRCLALSRSAAAQAVRERLITERNADVIKVECVEKGDEIRSDSEFVEIVIDIPQDVSEDHTKPDSVRSSAINVADVDRQYGVPTTHRQFLKDYHELKLLPPERFATYFLEIPTSKYYSLFGELLEWEMISRLLRGLARLLEAQGCLSSEISICLLSLADVPRFELQLMFFGDDEKRDLATICEFLSYSDRVDVKKRYLLEESAEE